MIKLSSSEVKEYKKNFIEENKKEINKIIKENLDIINEEIEKEIFSRAKYEISFLPKSLKYFNLYIHINRTSYMKYKQQLDSYSMKLLTFFKKKFYHAKGLKNIFFFPPVNYILEEDKKNKINRTEYLKKYPTARSYYLTTKYKDYYENKPNFKPKDKFEEWKKEYFDFYGHTLEKEITLKRKWMEDQKLLLPAEEQKKIRLWETKKNIEMS